MMDNQFVRLTERNSFQNMPGIMYWEKDNDSLYTKSNAYLCTLFGFSRPEEVLGHSDYDIPCAVSECADIFRQYDRLVMLENKPIKFFEVLHSVDGWKAMIVTKTPIHDVQNNIIGTCGYSVDVTHSFANIGSLLLKNQPFFKKNQSIQASYLVGANDKLHLTNRQSECLFLLLYGKAVKEIAKSLKVSPRTVECFIEQLKHKFNCRTRSELISVAIGQGFLNVIPPQFLSQQISIILE